MTAQRFRGVGVALVTPFTESGGIDFDALRRHVECQVDGGVQVLVPCGTTGESVTMTASEQAQVIEATVRAAAGRTLVMAGAGTNNTADGINLAKAARDAGADAILSVSPCYNKPSQAGLIRHYQALAEASGLPTFIYNVPGRTSSNVEASTVLELAKVDNIVGVKEASGNLEQAMVILRDRPEGFLVLSGDDSLALPLIAAGADGVISVVANEAPAQMAKLVEAALAGDFATARDIHYRLLPLMQANFIETNPVPVKAALEMMGKSKAHYRLPLVPLGEQNRAPLEQALRGAGLLE
ncbi:MAG: 4-hydroxy-tetrahydrodipicolinate synthase [Gemmatimonadetes bacterium]|nr:4-hydroxy-tetrahydrodipicolinate synthase [Gemmatimonadota bacterium]